jgi:tetratricopeptide (TPR) repeat protein
MNVFRCNSFSQFSQVIGLILATFLLISSPLAFSSSQTYPQQARSEIARARQWMREGQNLASQGRLAEAETSLVQAERVIPNDIELLTLLAKVKGRLGQPEEAAALFRRIVQLKPKVAENHLNLAIALADAKQLDAALAETSAAISLAPRSGPIHLNRARLLADLHRNEEARSEFALSSKLDPGNPDTFYYWSLLEHEQAHLAKETELLETLVKLQPNSDRDFFFLGRSLSEQSRHAESITALRRAIELNPHAGDALYMLAMEVKRQDPSEARTLMKRFVEVRDDAANLDAIETLGNQAYTASKQQNWEEAIRLLRQALAQCNECSVVAGLHRNLGLALCEHGNLREGKQELQQALELDPNDRDAEAALKMLPK